MNYFTTKFILIIFNIFITFHGAHGGVKREIGEEDILTSQRPRPIAKKRTSNFSAAETDFLVSLEKKHKSMIDCIKTDTSNEKTKKDVSTKNQGKYNSQSMENLRTGDRPTKLFPDSTQAISFDEFLQIKMAEQSSIYDLYNTTNVMGDTKLMKEEKEFFIIDDPEEEFVTVNLETQLDENKAVPKSSTSNTIKDWMKYTPNDLKSKSVLTSSYTPAANKHGTKKHKTNQDKITKPASTPASMAELQQAAFTEQHKLKIAFMHEKHETQMKMMNEKHKLELENLQLQKQILTLQKETLKL